MVNLVNASNVIDVYARARCIEQAGRMKRNALDVAPNPEAMGETETQGALSVSDDALLEVCELVDLADEEAANDAFYESYQQICELLSRVDYDASGQSLGEDLSELGDLRSRLRKDLVVGLSRLIGFMCLLLVGFATFSS